MEATLRPWSNWGNLIVSVGHGVICRMTGGTNTSAPPAEPGDPFWEQAGVDADFIVLACNCHDDLLAALQKIVNNWDNLHLKDRQQARLAIAKAKGGA